MQGSSRFEKICANLFILQIAIFICLCLAEVMMRYVFFHPSYKFAVQSVLDGHGKDLKVELTQDNLYSIQPNPQLGINKLGFRDKEFSASKKGKKRICFLGDSFVMGLNVKADETIPRYLDKELNGTFDVLNMGVVGFGPDQSLKVLEKYAPRLKPDVVVEGICALNDSNDITKNGLYTVASGGKLKENKTNPVKSQIFPSSLAIINQINFLRNRDELSGTLDPLLFGDSYDFTWMRGTDPELSEYKILLMRGILAQMKAVASQNKSKLVVLIIPSLENMCKDDNFVSHKIDKDKYLVNEYIYQKLTEMENITTINLAPYFMVLNQQQRCSLYREDDGHLSPLGNQYAAKIVAKYVANPETLQ